MQISGKEAPYDIFICYKETAENGDRTIDSVIAQDVYDALTEKGYKIGSTVIRAAMVKVAN